MLASSSGRQIVNLGKGQHKADEARDHWYWITNHSHRQGECTASLLALGHEHVG